MLLVLADTANTRSMHRMMDSQTVKIKELELKLADYKQAPYAKRKTDDRTIIFALVVQYRHVVTLSIRN